MTVELPTPPGEPRAPIAEARVRVPGDVRAAIEHDARLVRDDAAVGVDAGPEADAPARARGRRAHLVAVSRHRAHRATGRAREEREGVLVDGETLSAEVAADEAGVDDDLVRGHAESRRHLPAQREGRLVRRLEVDHVAFHPGHAGARFERAG